MAEWAEIVHARTNLVDFRPGLFCVPEDFTTEEVAWAKRHILNTTQSAASLQFDPPRWSVFQNREHRVVGITCMASALSDDLIAQTDIHGNPGRLLYLFAGYVARAPFPPLPPRDVELFRPLYQRVRDRWNDTYEENGDRTDFTLYRSWSYPAVPIDLEAKLNPVTEAIIIWPERQEDALWSAFASYRTQILSLCLGQARQKDVEIGPFLNATLVGGTERHTLVRQGKQTPSQPLTPPLDRRSEKTRPDDRSTGWTGRPTSEIFPDSASRERESEQERSSRQAPYEGWEEERKPRRGLDEQRERENSLRRTLDEQPEEDLTLGQDLGQAMREVGKALGGVFRSFGRRDKQDRYPEDGLEEIDRPRRDRPDQRRSGQPSQKQQPQTPPTGFHFSKDQARTTRHPSAKSVWDDDPAPEETEETPSKPRNDAGNSEDDQPESPRDL